MPKYWSPITFTFLWFFLVVIADVTRPALPVDETRYLAVAWEMWLRGDYIVPYLNGETYSHKPPLLFWLMNLGWAIFGVNDWWPPLVAPFFGLASLFLARKMAQKLWPDEPLIADLAPIILLGAAFWTLFTTVTMFDMLVAACTMCSLLGLLVVWRDKSNRGWLLVALGIGLGVLAKGPVILLQVLPIALLAPLWDVEGRIESLKKWYLNLLLAVLGGAVIALAWAIPAGILGGEEYRNAIFWGQTAGRVVNSFAHQRPWWWYLAVIGPLLLPWVLWPTLWKSGFQAAKKLWSEMQIRFCILWFVPIFIAFSFISGKQLHYLLPIFPAFAFLLARLLVKSDGRFAKKSLLVPVIFMLVFSVALAITPFAGIGDLPDWVFTLHSLWFLVPALVAVGMIFMKLNNLIRPVVGLTVLMSTFVMAIHLSFAPYLTSHFDLRPFAREIKNWQDEGYEVAFVAKYHGTFQFLGRLEKPIAELATNRGTQIKEWALANPKSKIITLWRADVIEHPAIDLVQDFRTRHFIVFDTARLNGEYTLVDRR